MTALMLLNTAAISPVGAESMLGSEYTFVDTCYSPEMGLYAAVAKKLGDKTWTPAQIWVSEPKIFHRESIMPICRRTRQ